MIVSAHCPSHGPRAVMPQRLEENFKDMADRGFNAITRSFGESEMMNRGGHSRHRSIVRTEGGLRPSWPRAVSAGDSPALRSCPPFRTRRAFYPADQREEGLPAIFRLLHAPGLKPFQSLNTRLKWEASVNARRSAISSRAPRVVSRRSAAASTLSMVK